MLYHPTLNENQRSLLKLIFPPASAHLRKHDPFDVLEAILFIVYTGCQWGRLPPGYRGAFKGNYEQYLCTARYMTLLAMISFMLRYFA